MWTHCTPVYQYTLIFINVSIRHYFPPLGVWSTAIIVSVFQSVSLSVSPLAYLKNRAVKFYHIFCIHVTCGHGSVLLWRQFNTSCTSGLVDTWRHIFHTIERMGGNQRRRVCFVQFARWRHREGNVPSSAASCICSVICKQWFWAQMWNMWTLTRIEWIIIIIHDKIRVTLSREMTASGALYNKVQ